MNTKAKFCRLILDHDKYLIQIDSKGIFLTKMCGSGDEKDCDAEMSWDEIYEACNEEVTLPSKATTDFMAQMEKDELKAGAE